MSTRVELSKRAQKDLRAMDKPTRKRVATALGVLPAPRDNADVKALKGHTPWLRLRVGNWRVLCRLLADDELSAGETAVVLVARVVHRSELEKAASGLQLAP